MEISVFQTRALPLIPCSGRPKHANFFPPQPVTSARQSRLKFHCPSITRIQLAVVFLKCPVENNILQRIAFESAGPFPSPLDGPISDGALNIPNLNFNYDEDCRG